jgi:peptide/nickel transport system substrate-binding protein
VELNPTHRKELYGEFQRIVQTDLPKLPIVFSRVPVAHASSLRGFWTGAYGTLDNFADAYLVAA